MLDGVLVWKDLPETEKAMKQKGFPISNSYLIYVFLLFHRRGKEKKFFFEYFDDKYRLMTDFLFGGILPSFFSIVFPRELFVF